MVTLIISKDTTRRPLRIILTPEELIRARRGITISGDREFVDWDNMMSDDDRDIDIESDVENDSDSRNHLRNSLSAGGYYSQAEKRAHHNALERKRRDHIKDSFTFLRDAVPALHGEKVASRAQILKKAAEYIQFMRRKNNSHQQDIEDLKRQNSILETQIRTLEKARATGNYMDAHEMVLGIKSEASSHDSDSSDGEGNTRRVKKLKIHGVSS